MAIPRPSFKALTRYRLSRWLLALAGTLTALGLIVTVICKERFGSPPSDEERRRRLELPVPYRNLDPAVRYVGDDACAGCHLDISHAFHQHPMGRTLVPVASAERLERYDQTAGNPFQRGEIEFGVHETKQGVHHQERRRDNAGRVVTQLDALVSYTVGSGMRGRTYLIQHGDFLFQSPISWFTQNRTWDLTPSVQIAEHFDRPVHADCLFCHANRVESVPHALNRYRPPLVRGTGIGCERCHGPGALHAASREQGQLVSGIDDTIVNPQDLPTVLRDAVCEQCHLQGESRIVRRGRDLFDYRPGFPLHEFLAVFVLPPEFSEHKRSGSHAAQMSRSACYRGSDGRLGCISCHDPHSLPEPRSRVAYYRARCLACHQDLSCALPRSARQERGDDCTACHMPRAAASNIAHTALTDHRIVRNQEAEMQSGRSYQPLRLGEVPIVFFHREFLDPETPDAGRDLGIALAEWMKNRGGTIKFLQKYIAPLALPLLRKATETSPDDLAAWESLGYVLWHVDRKEEAARALDKALALVPESETALTYAAVLAAERGRTADAVGYWKRVVRMNPWTARYHLELAKLLAAAKEWPQAEEEASAASRLSPVSDETRMLLITCLVRNGRKDRAQKEFEVLQTLNPATRGVLRDWFAEQVR